MSDLRARLEAQAAVPSAAQTYAVPVPSIARRQMAALPDGALVQAADGTFTFGQFQLTGVGLIAGEHVSRDDWLALGGILHKLDGSIQWLIGDWLVTGERRWGVTYQQVAAHWGYEVQTLRDMAYVCRAVDLSVRTDKLTFSHHKLVAAFAPDYQRQCLNYAAEQGMSVAELRAEISQANPKRLPERPALLSADQVSVLRDLSKMTAERWQRAEPRALRLQIAEARRALDALEAQIVGG